MMTDTTGTDTTDDADDEAPASTLHPAAAAGRAASQSVAMRIMKGSLENAALGGMKPMGEEQ